ncbi:hypothetical protein EKD16_10190 [Streptomonospora litoralis]|uniref:Uncharacterized protein n=1 Tax=Streptomonospora litoralis TaxID=2498135 RepID=A0A4P6Q4Q2_9ACTN|nr:hypothetical protein EKD16_10190 [Streptomonospora litoralis]
MRLVAAAPAETARKTDIDPQKPTPSEGWSPRGPRPGATSDVSSPPGPRSGALPGRASTRDRAPQRGHPHARARPQRGGTQPANRRRYVRYAGSSGDDRELMAAEYAFLRP